MRLLATLVIISTQKISLYIVLATFPSSQKNARKSLENIHGRHNRLSSGMWPNNEFIVPTGTENTFNDDLRSTWRRATIEGVELFEHNRISMTKIAAIPTNVNKFLIDVFFRK